MTQPSCVELSKGGMQTQKSVSLSVLETDQREKLQPNAIISHASYLFGCVRPRPCCPAPDLSSAWLKGRRKGVVFLNSYIHIRVYACILPFFAANIAQGVAFPFLSGFPH